MFQNINIQHQLLKLRHKAQQDGDSLVLEANRILNNELFAEKHILENLIQYNKSFELIDEEEVDREMIFSLTEIKNLCVIHRLKFLDSKHYKTDIPYEAILKIKDVNRDYHKDLRYFKILSVPESFNKVGNQESLLFAKTNHGSYFLIHKWGNTLKWKRKYKYWHLQQFENLFIALLVLTLCITLLLPTSLITLDHKAEYWSGYRAAAFFHLLIFNVGVTAYVSFAFGKNFSSSIWNQQKDFG